MQDVAFEPLPPTERRDTMASQAYGRIRDAIITTALKPGTRVSESEIADRFGVSRTPVREAFKRLQDEGLMDGSAQGGTRVSRLSMRRVHEAVFVRSTLESAVVRRAESTPTIVQLQSLEECIRQQKKAITAGDLALMHRVDMEFHRQIMVAFGQPLAWTACQFVSAEIARIQFLIGPEKPHLLAIVKEHQLVLKHLKANEIMAAAQALADHIGNVEFDQSVLADKSAGLFDMS
jgi:DNA-binding GntR family transcriptional regulator